MTIRTLLLLSCLAGTAAAQQPAPAGAGDTAAKTQDGDTWSEGFGRAPNYRSALAEAIEDAVGKVKGIAVARGPSLRSRLTVVTEHKDGDNEGWFDGQGEAETEWVRQQLQGFVQSYDVLEKQRGDDGIWEVTVKALVLGHDHENSAIVIELDDNDLRKWQQQRFHEDGDGAPFERRPGTFAGPEIGEYLRKSGAVQIVNGGAGVDLRSGSAQKEREKAGQMVVASHKVVVRWEPLVVQSTVERENKARPTRGPRYEWMSGGAVQVTVRIDDLVKGTELAKQTFAVDGSDIKGHSVKEIGAFVNKLVDRAKATVATKIFFTLRPPVVLRKWAGDDGKWFVEARMQKRVAAGFEKFSVGNDGSLASPDWQSFATARLVGGDDDRCTFELTGDVDAGRIDVDISQVRPVVQ